MQVALKATEIGGHGGERAIHTVGDASRELADRRHPLCERELRLELGVPENALAAFACPWDSRRSSYFVAA
jgi:hypothetical protein